MKSIIYFASAILATIASVSGQTVSNATQSTSNSLQMYGGPGGKLHDPISCAGTASVVQITGKQQQPQTADTSASITKLILVCSDGQQVSVGKDQGTDFALSSQPDGIRSFGISYSDRIKQMTYGDNAIQTSQQELIKFRVLSSPDNCPLNGVQVMADTDAGVIYAMTASFKCTTESKVSDIVAQAGSSGEDVRRSVFDSITRNMKEQYDSGLQEIRNQFQSIIDGLKSQMGAMNNGTLPASATTAETLN